MTDEKKRAGQMPSAALVPDAERAAEYLKTHCVPEDIGNLTRLIRNVREDAAAPSSSKTDRERAKVWCQRLRLGQSDADDESLAALLAEVRAEGFRAGRETPKTREEVLLEMTANMSDEQRRAFQNCAAPAFPTGAQVYVTTGVGLFTKWPGAK